MNVYLESWSPVSVEKLLHVRIHRSLQRLGQNQLEVEVLLLLLLLLLFLFLLLAFADVVNPVSDAVAVCSTCDIVLL